MTKNNNVSEEEWDALTKAALSAMDQAYAPYSQFHQHPLRCRWTACAGNSGIRDGRGGTRPAHSRYP